MTSRRFHKKTNKKSIKKRSSYWIKNKQHEKYPARSIRSVKIEWL